VRGTDSCLLACLSSLCVAVTVLVSSPMSPMLQYLAVVLSIRRC
jgi:hypothetical protein